MNSGDPHSLSFVTPRPASSPDQIARSEQHMHSQSHQTSAPGPSVANPSSTQVLDQRRAGQNQVPAQTSTQKKKKRPKKKNREPSPFKYLPTSGSQKGPAPKSRLLGTKSNGRDPPQQPQIKETQPEKRTRRVKTTLGQPSSSSSEPHSVSVFETPPQAGHSAGSQVSDHSGLHQSIPKPEHFHHSTSSQTTPQSSSAASLPNTSPELISPIPKHEPNEPAETAPTSLADKWHTIKIGVVDREPIVNDNKISNRAMGECIIRAAVHVLSRDFAYMTKDLFFNVYRHEFGNSGADQQHEQAFLSWKALKDIIQGTTTLNDNYYRLNPAYFQDIAVKLGLPPPSVKHDDLFCSMSNRVALPPIRPLDPRIVANVITQLESRLINIGSRYEGLLPSRFIHGPLYDFRHYLTVWHPVRMPKLSDHFVPTPSASGSSPSQTFSQLIQKAKGSGVQAKNARKALTNHSAKVLAVIEKERQDEYARMLTQYETETNAGSSDMDKDLNQASDTRQVYEVIDSDSSMEIDDPVSHGLTSAPEILATPGGSTDSKSKAPERTLERAPSPIVQELMLRRSCATTKHGQTEVVDLTEDAEGETIPQPPPIVHEAAAGTSLPRPLKLSTYQEPIINKGSLKAQRFAPYPTLKANEGSFSLKKNDHKMVSPGHSRGSGSMGSIQIAQGPFSYTPPPGNVFTLPRPTLPPVDRKDGSSVGTSFSIVQRAQSGTIVGADGSNLVTGGQQHSRGQIIKDRREALDKIIDLVWKTLEMPREGAMKEPAFGSSSSAQRLPPS
ncbi:hypothetical protein B0O80DRAFT_452485 [Mortierella sp. GBAus27b]|nr:hypothetical protein B0O80DRAFT_452485 [Mortierella sp. GBAus27b]